MAHTKGEEIKTTPYTWKVREFGREGEEWPERRLSVGSKETGECVCISPRFWTDNKEKTQADFELIAAAPDLLEALEDYYERFEMELSEEDEGKQKAKQAIKKAKGE